MNTREMASSGFAPGAEGSRGGRPWHRFAVMDDLASTEAIEHASENVASDLAAKGATLLQRAVELLFPTISPTAPKPFLGRHKAILELLQHRTTIDTVRQWQHGRRPTPRWVRKIVHDELQARASAMRQIAAALAAEQDRSKPGDSLRRYWQNKKAARVASGP